MTELSTKAKLALAGGGVALLALAVALGVWQPWRADDPEESDQQVGEVLPPAEEKQETGLSLTVGGETIPCVLYEGDDWSMYVPEEWTVDANENGGIFLAPGDVESAPRVEIIRSTSAVYSGKFVSAYPQQLSAAETWQTRHFYTGSPQGSWEAVCSASDEDWDKNQRLMTALVRTLTVGEEKPFSGLSPVASQPDWQIMEGETLLWMDKDAYIVDDVTEELVVTRMMAWDSDTKKNYTGQYRMDDLVWAGSYTCLDGEAYVDIFQTTVYYKVADGAEDKIPLAGGMSITDGWMTEGKRMNVVLFHDGSAVEEARAVYTGDTGPGQPLFAADLMGAGSAA